MDKIPINIILLPQTVIPILTSDGNDICLTDPPEYDPFTCLNLMTEADAASRTMYNLNTPKTMALVQHKFYNALPLIM
jgi:hypothetical protein